MIRIVRTTLIAILLGVLISFLDASPASACTCAGTQADVAHMADAIFSGSVIEDESEPAVGRYLFEVEQVFKGRVHERQWVDAGSKYAGCGTTFNASTSWLVLATGTDALRTDYCMQSSSIDQAAPHLLTNPSEPIDGTSPGGGDGTPPWLILGGVAVAVAATAALLASASRRLRQHIVG